MFEGTADHTSLSTLHNTGDVKAQVAMRGPTLNARAATWDYIPNIALHGTTLPRVIFVINLNKAIETWP